MQPPEENPFDAIPDSYAREDHQPDPATQETETSESDPVDDSDSAAGVTDDDIMGALLEDVAQEEVIEDTVVEPDVSDEEEEDDEEEEEEKPRKKLTKEEIEQRKQYRKDNRFKKENYDRVEAERNEFEGKVETLEKEKATLISEIETLKTSHDEKIKEYTKAFTPAIDPAKDEELGTHRSNAMAALERIPSIFEDEDGEPRRRQPMDQLLRDPSLGGIMSQAMNAYSTALHQGDTMSMDNAVNLIRQAVGAPEDVRTIAEIDSAVREAVGHLGRMNDRKRWLDTNSSQLATESYHKTVNQSLERMDAFNLPDSRIQELKNSHDEVEVAVGSLATAWKGSEKLRQKYTPEVSALKQALAHIRLEPPPLADQTPETIQAHQQQVAAMASAVERVQTLIEPAFLALQMHPTLMRKARSAWKRPATDATDQSLASSISAREPALESTPDQDSADPFSSVPGFSDLFNRQTG